MPTSETIATAITDEHQHQQVKITSWPVMTWLRGCVDSALVQTGSQPKVLYVHPETAKLIQCSLFETQSITFDVTQLNLCGASVEVTTSVPRYCASILLSDNRVAVVDHNGTVVICL